MFFSDLEANDRHYRAMVRGDEERDVRARAYVEEIWNLVHPFVDADAPAKAAREFVSVFWELHLAFALACSGKTMAPRNQLGYVNNKGPDLFVLDSSVWLEAIVVGPGEGPDALNFPEMMKVYNYSPDAVVLRLRSVIEDKSKKLREYLRCGVIRNDQPTVIAISGVRLPYRFSGVFPPEIFRAVYPANNPVLVFDRHSKAHLDTYIEHRDAIRKTLGAIVATDIFLKPEFEHVSAVLFGESDWVTPPEPAGADFKLVHNMRAVAPLPDRWLQIGNEYWWQDGSIEFICHNSQSRV
jgi:hypothetical protein